MITEMTRISIRDARYVYGRDAVDLAGFEPVEMKTADGQNVWLCKDSRNNYQVLPYEMLEPLRDDGSFRPYVHPIRGLQNSQPLGW